MKLARTRLPGPHEHVRVCGAALAAECARSLIFATGCPILDTVPVYGRRTATGLKAGPHSAASQLTRPR